MEQHTKALAAISKLLFMIDTLFSDKGCPWDKGQTLESFRNCLIEEAYEVADEIESHDYEKLKNELGDVLLTALFMIQLAKQANIFSLEDVMTGISEKLIRRKPHVFGDIPAVKTEQEAIDIWNWVKMHEKKGIPQSALDSIPNSLPALAKAQKMLKKMKACGFLSESKLNTDEGVLAQEVFGERLFVIVEEAEAIGIDAEESLRKTCIKKRKEYATWESHQSK